jgi:peptidyl-prolyl cis-trans isomerase D
MIQPFFGLIFLQEDHHPMLDVLRKRKRSWIIIFFLGLIVFTFVLYFGGRVYKEPGLESVAKVNGEVVSQREFALEYERLVDLYRETNKGTLTPEMMRSLNFKGMLLEQMIQRRLLLQEVRRLGLGASDEEVMQSIANVPGFQIDGRFSKNRYVQVLRTKRLSPAQFEAEYRDQLATQKLYALILDAVRVTEEEVRERYRLEQERVNFHFIRLPSSKFMSQVQIKEEEIKNYYEKNKEALKQPLRVQVEYLVYPFDQFSSKVQVNEKDIEEYYRANQKTKFHQPQAARVRHILIRVPSDADAKQKVTVRSKAEELVREARSGKDFGELAKEYSDDPNSAQGGDLGWLTPGELPPPLDKAAFTVKKEETISLVETSLGYHILKVEDRREEKAKTLKEAKDEIVRAIRAERGRAAAAEAADGDRERALSGTDFSLLAKERGIPFRVSPFFSTLEPVPEVGSVEQFSKAAFSLGPKEISSPIDGPVASYLIRVKERREAAVPPFEAVRAEIEKRLRTSKALELATQSANSLLQELKKERDIKKVGIGHGLSVEETGWFLRSTSEIPKMGAMQEMRPGEIPISAQRPIPDRVYAEKGDLYLFEFKGTQGADMERFEKQKSQFQETVLREKKQRAIQGFIESLKAKARIEVEPHFLEES